MKRFRLMRRPSAARIIVLAMGIWALASGPASLAHLSAGPALEPRLAQAADLSRTATVIRLHQSLVRVTIHNFTFAPARLVVSPNTRIVWTNGDSDPHTVTSDRGVWASDALDTGNRFVRAFKTVGTFPYHCAIHPFMHGSVTVKR